MCPKDHAEAARLFAKAAAHDDPVALYHLGTMRLNGDGLAKDRDRAETALRKSARRGYLPAMIALGEFYALGGGAEPDLREAAHWYEKAAEQGDVQAQFLTGRFYATGDGVAPSLREAAKWFLRAAENGHATAAFNIATFYANGSGVKQDTKSAIKWFEVAAKGGTGAARIQLGRLYANGSGVERDHARAEQWLQQAANSGDPEAKVAYALFLLQSDKSGRSLNRSIELLTQAADAKYVPASLQLGHLYAGRLGAPAFMSQAVRWYGHAGEAGSVDAMMALAQLHLDPKSGVGGCEACRELVRARRRCWPPGRAIPARGDVLHRQRRFDRISSAASPGTRPPPNRATRSGNTISRSCCRRGKAASATPKRRSNGLSAPPSRAWPLRSLRLLTRSVRVTARTRTLRLQQTGTEWLQSRGMTWRASVWRQWHFHRRSSYCPILWPRPGDPGSLCQRAKNVIERARRDEVHQRLAGCGDAIHPAGLDGSFQKPPRQTGETMRRLLVEDAGGALAFGDIGLGRAVRGQVRREGVMTLPAEPSSSTISPSSSQPCVSACSYSAAV